MKTYFTLSLLLIFIGSITDAAGQIVLADKGKNRYLVDDHFYHYRDLGDFFKEDATQLSLYNESIYQLNQARNAGVIAAVVIGVGLTALAIDGTETGPCDFFCVSDGQLIFALSLLALPIVAIVGLNSKFSYSAKKKKLLDMYNSKFDSSLLQQMNGYDYSFSGASSGIGIALNF